MDEEELEQPRKKITLSNFFDSIVSVEKVADRALKKTNANLDIINQNKSLIAALTQSFDDLKVEIREIKEYITIEKDLEKDKSLSQEDREQKLRRLERTFMGGEGSEGSLDPEDEKQQENFFDKALKNPNVLQIIAGGVLSAVAFGGGSLLSAFGIKTDSQKQSEQSGKITGKRGFFGGVGGTIDAITGNLTDFDRRGGKPVAATRAATGIIDFFTGNLFDLDRRGDFVNSREDLAEMKEKLKQRKRIGKEIKGFNLGGPVFDNDNDTTNNNEDSVPAMLTPGEFVVTKDAVDKIGVDTLKGLNASVGATNEDLNKIITTQNPDAEEAPRLPGLGGGGGGTNAITMKSKSKTFGKRLKDVGKILTYPISRKNIRVDPNEKFASEEYVNDLPRATAFSDVADTEDDPLMNFNNDGLVEGVKKMFSSSEDEIVKNPFEVENTNTPDFALLTAISALEGGDSQARVDVAQSIYNRLNEVKKDIADGPGTTAITDYTREDFRAPTGVFPEPTLSDIILKDAQYQPTYIDPTKKEGPKTAVSDEFKNVKDRKSAIVAMKSYYDKRKMPMSIKQIEELYDQTVIDLQDQKMNKSASAFVGGRTEFRGGIPTDKSMVTGTDRDRGEGSSMDPDNRFFVGKQKQLDGSFRTLGTGTQLETGAAVSPLLKSPLESGASVSPLLKSSLESDLQSNLLPMIESKSNGSAQSVFTPPESSQGSNITLLPMPVGDTQPQPINANDPVIAPVRPPEVTTTPVASTMSSVSFVNMISNKQLSIG